MRTVLEIANVEIQEILTPFYGKMELEFPQLRVNKESTS